MSKEQKPTKKRAIRGHRPKLADRVHTYQIRLPGHLYDMVREAGPNDVRETLTEKYSLI